MPIDNEEAQHLERPGLSPGRGRPRPVRRLPPWGRCGTARPARAIATLAILFASVAGATLPALARAPDPPSAPGVTPAGGDFVLPPAPVAPWPDAAATTLRAVRFAGASRLAAAELDAIAAPFLNRPLRPLDLEELRQRVTRAYVERGFVNSGAVLAADALQGDTLTLRIVEGRVARLRQSGLQGLSERYLAARLLRGDDEVLDVNQLQDRFRLQLADPLFSRLQARLLPGATPGEAVLDIEATRAEPWQARLFFHNHVAPAVGSTRAGIEGVWHDLLGWGDALTLALALGRGGRLADAAWALPLLAGRTMLTLHVANGESSVIEEPVAALDLESRVGTREATLSHPLVDTSRARWAAGLTHALRRNRTSLAGFPFGFVPGEPEDGLRVESWRLFQELTLRREQDVYALRASVLQGRNNLVPEPLLPAQPPNRYRLWQLQGQASIVPGAAPGGSEAGAAGGATGTTAPLVLRALLQRSPDALVPLEQLAVGGRNTVRGYRENQLVRDNGWALGLEWHWPLWRDPVRRAAVTLVPFADAGAAWNRDQPRSRLASAGLGLLWTVAEVEGELFVARRLVRRDPPTHGDLQDRGIHFLLRWRPAP